jgi:predicted amidohydrolase
MDACVRRYAAATGLPLPAAAACASSAAARLLGLEGRKGALDVGCDADIVVLDGQGQVLVIAMSFTATAVIITVLTGPHHMGCRRRRLGGQRLVIATASVFCGWGSKHWRRRKTAAGNEHEHSNAQQKCCDKYAMNMR